MRRGRQGWWKGLAVDGKAMAVWGSVIWFALSVVAPAAHAQNFQVLHTFTGGQDGGAPDAGLTLDRAGNLYGTAEYGGTGPCQTENLHGCGTVFQLTHRGTGWTFAPLYSFNGWLHNDGAYPVAGVSIATDGSLYGATMVGGSLTQCQRGPGCGTVFRLQPPARACQSVLCPWLETVVYRFTPAPDAYYPTGTLIFDQAGNLYGTTRDGGAGDFGTVYEVTHANGGWTENVIYSFDYYNGAYPAAGVIFDTAGNLYGTAVDDGYYINGTVYELTRSGSGWTGMAIYNFTGGEDGYQPIAGVIFDSAGNLYGATANGRPDGEGIVYQLTPSGGVWNYTPLHSFIRAYGRGPGASLVMDAAGNLYGTASGVPLAWGSVFKLTPSNGSWIYTDLHDFTGGSDGGYPFGGVILDGNGNLYGTTYGGGNAGCVYGCGVVYEITP